MTITKWRKISYDTWYTIYNIVYIIQYQLFYKKQFDSISMVSNIYKIFCSIYILSIARSFSYWIGKKVMVIFRLKFFIAILNISIQLLFFGLIIQEKIKEIYSQNRQEERKWRNKEKSIHRSNGQLYYNLYCYINNDYFI